VYDALAANPALFAESVIKTATEKFGLDGPLNDRDKSAASFANLFTRLSAPRAAGDIPATLNRPPLDQAVMSLAAGIPVDPADEPLDSLTQEWMEGFAELIARRTGAALVGPAAVEPIPASQGEAAEFIDRHLRNMGI
jgi:hypothetical protein